MPPIEAGKDALYGCWHAQRQVTAVDIVEQCPRPLVQHVRIEASRAEQANPPLPQNALGLRCVAFLDQFRDLQIEALPRVQPAVAGIGIDAEIADEAGCSEIETEHGEDRSQPPAGDHARTMERFALRAL